MNKILPVNRTKRQARRNYDRISGIYDWITASEKDYIEKGVRALAIAPGEKILEIGSGTGTGLALIAEALAGEGRVVGVDLARQMLTESQKKTRDANPTPLLVQGDGARLPLQSDQFNAVFCSFTLELFAKTEIVTVLSEIKRVLRPSGRLAVVALAQQPRTLAVKLYERAHQWFPVAVDCRPIPLPDLLKENGYQIQSTTKLINWGLPIDLVVSKTR
jgi:ubiquinone/menaquinone biosynthesis C-methylase UbiE